MEKRQRVRRQEAESTQTRGGENAEKRRRVRRQEAESTGTRGGEKVEKRRRVRGRIEPEAGGAARLGMPELNSGAIDKVTDAKAM